MTTLFETAAVAEGWRPSDHPEPAIPPPVAGRHRRADIQGLRAIAVLLVVAFHAALPVPGGFVGVDVFFVISGYVITGMLVREHERYGRIRFARFFARRFKRLTPALSAVLLATLALSAVLQSPMLAQHVTALTALGAITLSANKAIQTLTGGYFQEGAATNPLLHTWSLSVEEQFYIVFPFLLAAAWWLSRRRRGIRWAPVAAVAALTTVSALVAIGTSVGHTFHLGEFLSGYYSPLTRAWEFGAGALLVWMPQLSLLRRRGISLLLSVAGLLLLGASAVMITDQMPFPGVATLLPVAGTALLLHTGGLGGGVARALSLRPLRVLGDLSYSWYLWHWPLIVFAGLMWPGRPVALAIAALLSLLPAAASYRWVEQPVRELTLRRRRGFLSLAAGVLIPVLALGFGVNSAAADAWGSKDVRAFESAISAQHEGWTQCLSVASRENGGTTNLDFAGCEWNRAARGAPVYLVGDSNAAHFSEAAIGAGSELGRPVYLRSEGACPFIDVYRQIGPLFDGPDVRCREYVDSTLSWLLAAPHGTVIISNIENYWTHGYDIGSNRDNLTMDKTARAAFLTRGLESLVDKLKAVGDQVVLVQSVPHPLSAGDSWDPRDCSTLAILSHRCTVVVPLSAVEVAQAPSRATVNEVASHTGAYVLDLRNSFCSGKTCSVTRGNELLYQDSSHITVKESKALIPRFALAIRQGG